MRAVFHKNWQGLVKPIKPDVRCNRNITTLIIEPLERGFGFTLGHALRRVLLSSLHGAAVSSVRIQGGPLNLSAEDRETALTDLILNIKDIALRMDADIPSTQLSLRKRGAGVVRAGSLRTSEAVKILNPEHRLCSVGTSGDIQLDLTVTNGKGYQAARPVPLEEWREGEPIAIDAVYSPARQVTLAVENTRKGQFLDYDHLTMTVVTNGAITGEEAVNRAAHILHDQLSVFINFEEIQPDQPEVESGLPFSPVLLKKMEDFELSVRSSNCMKNNNIVYVGDLVIMTEAQLLRVPNFGRKSLHEIKTLLADIGLYLGMQIPEWPPENLEQMAERHAKEADM